MNSNIVKSEQFDHLPLVYHFTVPLIILINWERLSADRISCGTRFQIFRVRYPKDFKLKLLVLIVLEEKSVREQIL